MDEDTPPAGGTAPRRAPRRDAERNRESLVAGALRAIARDGLAVPVATIAAEAGVGNATFYRCFPDRHALMVELEHRAYDKLIAVLAAIVAGGLEGLPAIHRFLVDSLDIGEDLILPLHGAPPLVEPEAVAKRQRIDGQIEVFLTQARGAGAVREDVNATDVIICSALVTQPLRQGPDWVRSARRHVALFVAGIATEGALPAAAVLQDDLELAWQTSARSRPETGGGAGPAEA